MNKKSAFIVSACKKPSNRLLPVFQVVLGLALASSSYAAPFYKDNFNFDSRSASSNATDALAKVGWGAFKSGSKVRVFGNLKVFKKKVVPPDFEDTVAYNSLPTGPDDGFTLWSKPVAALTIFTDEYSFDISKLAKVSYRQKLYLTDASRFAIRVRALNGTVSWYISEQVATTETRNAYQYPNFTNIPNVDEVPAEFDPRTLTYTKVTPNVADTGPSLGAGETGTSLPATGVVTGFGIYLDTVNGRVKVDNFVLGDSNTSSNLKPDVLPPGTTGGTPVTDPDDDTDTVVPTPVPGAPTPGPTAVPTAAPGAAYNLCISSTKKVKKVVATRAIQKKIVAVIKGSSVKDLRNKIIVELLAAGISPISLENVTLSDFFTSGRNSYLNVFGQDKRAVKLSSRQKKALVSYIAKAQLTDGSSPLLRDLKGSKVTTSALCRRSLSSLIKSAISKARVSRSVRFR